jgi:hypothetical protein
MRDIERQMRALLDRQQIYEVLTRYYRGVDRGDVELIRSVYHADAAWGQRNKNDPSYVASAAGTRAAIANPACDPTPSES